MRAAMDVVVAAALVGALAACSRVTVEPLRARILLNSDSSRPTIDVVDAPPSLLASLSAVEGEQWVKVFRVEVGVNPQPMRGQYEIVGDRVRFTPMAPFSRGRPYHVTFSPPGWESMSAVLTLPAVDLTPSTSVTQVFPSVQRVPSNQRRFYIHFSAPMTPRGAIDFVHLFDAGGNTVESRVLPSATEPWNADRTIYTFALDSPADALVEGQSYTLAIDAAWRDAQGLPMKQPFRHTFTVGPPDDGEVDPGGWKVTVPAAGSLGPIVIILPEPLDRELLLRAINVSADRKTIAGQVALGAGESTWTFVPEAAWQAGSYTLTVSGLEDLAGNGLAGDRKAVLVPITIR